MTVEQIKERLAELYAAQEAATGWGAAVGARHEEIQGLESALGRLERLAVSRPNGKTGDARS